MNFIKTLEILYISYIAQILKYFEFGNYSNIFFIALLNAEGPHET
jgi:hypothetical protein